MKRLGEGGRGTLLAQLPGRRQMVTLLKSRVSGIANDRPRQEWTEQGSFVKAVGEEAFSVAAAEERSAHNLHSVGNDFATCFL